MLYLTYIPSLHMHAIRLILTQFKPDIEPQNPPRVTSRAVCRVKLPPPRLPHSSMYVERDPASSPGAVRQYSAYRHNIQGVGSALAYTAGTNWARPTTALLRLKLTWATTTAIGSALLHCLLQGETCTSKLRFRISLSAIPLRVCLGMSVVLKDSVP